MSQQQPEETAPLDEFVQRHVAEAARRRREREDAEATLRAGTLASDTDRDITAQVLNQAFAEGRLTPDEHADRTTRAFTARTHGDLDQVLVGIQVPTAPAPTHGARKLLFWAVTVMTSPFLMMGVGLTLSGDGIFGRVFGIILLGLFAPGLYALYRRAWPSEGERGWSHLRRQY